MLSMALTAVRRLVEGCGVRWEDVGMVQVGSESLLDRSKSLKSHLMALFPAGAVSVLLINTHDTKPVTVDVDVGGLSSARDDVVFTAILLGSVGLSGVLRWNARRSAALSTPCSPDAAAPTPHSLPETMQ